MGRWHECSGTAWGVSITWWDGGSVTLLLPVRHGWLQGLLRGLSPPGLGLPRGAAPHLSPLQPPPATRSSRDAAVGTTADKDVQSSEGGVRCRGGCWEDTGLQHRQAVAGWLGDGPHLCLGRLAN